MHDSWNVDFRLYPHHGTVKPTLGTWIEGASGIVDRMTTVEIQRKQAVHAVAITALSTTINAMGWKSFIAKGSKGSIQARTTWARPKAYCKLGV